MFPDLTNNGVRVTSVCGDTLISVPLATHVFVQMFLHVSRHSNVIHPFKVKNHT